MQNVIIVGAGGHGQVIADILLSAMEAGEPLHPVGYVDDNPRLHGLKRLGLPVLGSISDLPALGHDAVILGIGDNWSRCLLFDRLTEAGEHFVVARHPTAIIARSVEICLGTVICAGVAVGTGSRIGCNAILNTACSVDHHNVIGDHAHIAPGSHLGGDVQIGPGTLIGIGASVISQRQVGEWSVVGAGAVVHHSIPGEAVAVGVPARVTRHLLTVPARQGSNVPAIHHISAPAS